MAHPRSCDVGRSLHAASRDRVRRSTWAVRIVDSLRRRGREESSGWPNRRGVEREGGVVGCRQPVEFSRDNFEKLLCPQVSGYTKVSSAELKGERLHARSSSSTRATLKIVAHRGEFISNGCIDPGMDHQETDAPVKGDSFVVSRWHRL